MPHQLTIPSHHCLRLLVQAHFISSRFSMYHTTKTASKRRTSHRWIGQSIIASQIGCQCRQSRQTLYAMPHMRFDAYSCVYALPTLAHHIPPYLTSFLTYISSRSSFYSVFACFTTSHSCSFFLRYHFPPLYTPMCSLLSLCFTTSFVLMFSHSCCSFLFIHLPCLDIADTCAAPGTGSSMQVHPVHLAAPIRTPSPSPPPTNSDPTSTHPSHLAPTLIMQLITRSHQPITCIICTPCPASSQ